MKKIPQIAFLCFLFLTGIIININASAQTEAEMKAWQAYMTPGEMHQLIASTDGEWDADITMWMDPKSQPITSKGSCTNAMIFGGRYQESNYQATFMDQPMEGKGIMAYDNQKKQFESTWIDNMGSGIMKMSGTYDPATKTISLSGTQIDPMTGKDCKMRETLKIIDDSHHVMTMYMTPSSGGPEFKSMEIKFAKK